MLVARKEPSEETLSSTLALEATIPYQEPRQDSQRTPTLPTKQTNQLQDHGPGQSFRRMLSIHSLLPQAKTTSPGRPHIPRTTSVTFTASCLSPQRKPACIHQPVVLPIAAPPEERTPKAQSSRLQTATHLSIAMNSLVPPQGRIKVSEPSGGSTKASKAPAIFLPTNALPCKIPRPVQRSQQHVTDRAVVIPSMGLLCARLHETHDASACSAATTPPSQPYLARLDALRSPRCTDAVGKVT